MSSNTKTSILVICLMALNSVDCQAVCFPDFYEEAIITAGYVHFEISYTILNITQSIGYLLYDIYKQAFIATGFTGVGYYKTQGGFFIAQCEDEPDDPTEQENCKHIERLRDIYGVRENQPFLFRFYFIYEKEIWERRASADTLLPTSNNNTWKLEEDEDVVPIWPPEWAEKDRVDKMIMGAASYLDGERKFIYVINGKSDRENAVVYTRTLEEIRKEKPWTATPIPNTAGKKFISLFYWFLNGTVLAQVKPNSTMHVRYSQIYKFDPKSPEVFTLLYKSVKDLWGCKRTTTESNELLIVVLLVITVAMLTITVLFIGYFLYHLFIRKKADPVFGLRVKRR